MSSWTRDCFQRAPASVKWRGGGQGWVQRNNNQGISFDHRLSPGPRPSVTVSVTPGHVLPGTAATLHTGNVVKGSAWG